MLVDYRAPLARTPLSKNTAVPASVRAENSLLAALPQKDFWLLEDFIEPVKLNFGDVIYRPGEPIQHVYFPTDSLVSLLTLAEGHQALEVVLVGCEGMLGIPLALGGSGIRRCAR